MKLMLDRMIFTLFGAIVGGGTYSMLIHKWLFREKAIFNWQDIVWTFISSALAGLVFFAIYPEVVKFFSLLQKIISRIMKKTKLTDVIILVISLFVTVLTFIFLEPIERYLIRDQNLNTLVTFLTPIILFIIFWMIGISKRDAIIEASRGFFVAPTGNKELYILDTSCLVDGRVANLLSTSTLQGRFTVPSFVLLDLQRISDSADPILAHRGKRGLLTLEKIQDQMAGKLEVMTTQNKGRQIDLLYEMAKDGARIISCDMEITAELRKLGAQVVNLNEAASALKTVIVPGEEVIVKIIKEGKEHSQGVGFLDDGTMVVIEDGRNAIGQTVRIICTSLLQNPQGRIVFGRIEK
ncbi:MAG: hypothetical protein KA140_02085 [Caldisericia bacterium]|nr:hypothetical protein [Caldisericia bacterium]